MCLLQALKPRRIVPTFALRKLTLAPVGPSTSPPKSRSLLTHRRSTRRVRDYLSISGALRGSWKVGKEDAVLQSAPGKIIFRFHARDLHLVLGPTKNGRPVRFVVKLDATPPGEDHGGDTDADGTGRVEGHRLYQLIRQKRAVEDRMFEIEFLDPSVQAFAFKLG
jgi:hypothetical protein